MQCTLTVEPFLSIVSGLNSPILFFKNTASGTIIVNSVTGYAIDEECELIMRRNVTVPVSGQFFSTISGLIPNDSDLPVIISGFRAQKWDGNSAGSVIGISGYIRDGDVVFASYAGQSPAQSHFNGRYLLRSLDNFALWAKSTSATPSKLFLDIELTFDLSGNIAPLGGSISQDPEFIPPPV